MSDSIDYAVENEIVAIPNDGCNHGIGQSGRGFAASRNDCHSTIFLSDNYNWNDRKKVVVG